MHSSTDIFETPRLRARHIEPGDIEQMLAAGDSHVVIRWRSRGTHRGPLANIPATGKSATNHGCTVMELRNAKVSRAWVYFDNAHLLRQLGVLPA